ncbi:MAG: hypothetical protein ABF289_19520 [Clostridiales bacterium]
MAGQIDMMIKQIIEKRSKGNPSIENLTRAKLVLKGFNPANYNASSPDDPAIIVKLKKLATELKVTL